jgi:hypothetical protein
VGTAEIPAPAAPVATGAGDGGRLRRGVPTADQAIGTSDRSTGRNPVAQRTDMTSRRRDAHDLWRGLRGLLALLVAAVGLAVCCSPASALLDRGHVFSGTFEGSGAQAFGTPGGVAVGEASGEVYVADPAGERVERFGPASAGYGFAGEFKVAYPGAVAIDNSGSGSDPSSGDVYVAGAGSVKEVKEAKEAGIEPERNYLYKFTASGEMIFKKRIFKAKEAKEESGEKVVEEFETGTDIRPCSRCNRQTVGVLG